MDRSCNSSCAMSEHTRNFSATPVKDLSRYADTGDRNVVSLRPWMIDAFFRLRLYLGSGVCDDWDGSSRRYPWWRRWFELRIITQCEHVTKPFSIWMMVPYSNRSYIMRKNSNKTWIHLKRHHIIRQAVRKNGLWWFNNAKKHEKQLHPTKSFLGRILNDDQYCLCTEYLHTGFTR